ncbi:MAG TPA: polysaccharide deacetylase family protein [Polyangiaceae bacterium]
MLASAGRTLLLLASLAAGSWIGLGRPSARASVELAQKARSDIMARLQRSPMDYRDHGEPLPSDRITPAVDPSQLPDPNPFPRLNPEESTRRAWLLSEGPAHAPGDGKRLVTFTFDDGPFPETTPAILDLLARHHVRATFFWIGRYLEGDGDRAVTTRAVARQVVAAGHYVGNHTEDHEKLTAIPRARALAQIDDCSAAIERVIGTRPTLFRPPYGALDPWQSDVLRARGLDLVLWNIEAADMTHGDPAQMFDSLRDQLEYAGGGIVLLHDIRLTTIPVLSALLDWVDAHHWDPRAPEKEGYEVVDLAGYLQATARSPQPFPDRHALEHARAVESLRHRSARGRTVTRVLGSEGDAVVEQL